MEYEKLSDEQKQFVQYAMQGHNILVDACIGSGKTMAIQTLCSFARQKRILYLTYNKLLKLDAQDRIRNGLVRVTNYHGFCWKELRDAGVSCGISELIQTYNRVRPACSKYDVLILDEYQDIEEEIAEVLEHIKASCPGIQIIAVGDMSQKIYDKTRLDVQAFITSFLGNYIPMEFTVCFRLGEDHAEMLGRVWGKTIHGVNEDFEIQELYEFQIRKIVSRLKPEQLLVLGSKMGKAQELQNYLENEHRDVYNKHTLWSKIQIGSETTSPTPDCAIFTTYDGCKGMEREVCVLYDWAESYWEARLEKPDTKYEIIRNVFCVAASRAKRLLIIAKTDCPLTEDHLASPDDYKIPFQDMTITEMFDYKYVEDVEQAFQALKITKMEPEGITIDIPVNDALIDLTPCIEPYIKALYFERYDIDEELEYYLSQYDRSHMRRSYEKFDLGRKLLYLAAVETKQQRYMNQVKELPVTEENKQKIRSRLAERFTTREQVSQGGGIRFYEGQRLAFTVSGMTDLVKNGVVYRLGYTRTVSHVDLLKVAMQMIATTSRKACYWNIRTGELYEIEVPDVRKLLDRVARAVTKGRLHRYQISKDEVRRMLRILEREPEKQKRYAKWAYQWFNGTWDIEAEVRQK